MNSQMGDPLAELRDIHLPDPISWWPPAWGWWLAAALILAATIGLYIIIRKFWRSRRYRKAGLDLATRYYADYLANNDALQYCQQANILLRRTALVAYGHARVAHLSGRQWLQFLDQQVSEETGFSTWGADFEELPYRAHLDDLDIAALDVTVRHWLQKHEVAND